MKKQKAQHMKNVVVFMLAKDYQLGCNNKVSKSCIIKANIKPQHIYSIL